MTNTIRDCIRGLSIGMPQRHQNVTMYPLLHVGDGAGPNYELCDHAIRLGTVVVEEVSATGSVPELSLKNSSDLPVLIIDGQELEGAKQNRVLNVSVLAPPHAVTVIPVSCVERGRWRHTTRSVTSSPSMYYAAMRARMKEDVYRSLREEGRRSSDQGEVWRDIERKSHRLRTSSSTGAMSDIYRQRSANIEEFVESFHPVHGQVGAAFAVDGGLRAADVFDRENVLRVMLARLVRSIALDAIDPGNDVSERAGSAEPAEQFLLSLAEASVESFPAVGMGQEVRISGGKVTGAALIFPADDSSAPGRVIHLCAFRR